MDPISQAPADPAGALLAALRNGARLAQLCSILTDRVVMLEIQVADLQRFQRDMEDRANALERDKLTDPARLDGCICAPGKLVATGSHRHPCPWAP
jgi:hypothetical protein